LAVKLPKLLKSDHYEQINSKNEKMPVFWITV